MSYHSLVLTQLSAFHGDIQALTLVAVAHLDTGSLNCQSHKAIGLKIRFKYLAQAPPKISEDA